jgi:4-diphosphocytidyl-2C-methyl-D-erythritol kinase
MDKLFAYSKVNFILKVYPKFEQETKHKIHSLFCLYKRLFDEIYIEESNKTTITFKNNTNKIKIDKTKMESVIKFLSNKLKRELALKIIIVKNIPIMSGLGGSATDLAAIIK